MAPLPDSGTPRNGFHRERRPGSQASTKAWTAVPPPRSTSGYETRMNGMIRVAAIEMIVIARMFIQIPARTI